MRAALQPNAITRTVTPLPMDILKSALRSLRAHPLFSILIVALLALGIGANTAIFGVVHAVLLKPLPYPQPGELVMVRKPPADPSANLPGGGDQMPDAEFLSWVEAVPKTFRSLAAYRNSNANLHRDAGAVRVPTATVTGEFFPMLGVTAWRGRLFGAEDMKVGAAPVTVISHQAWLTRFNGAEDIIGQIAKIDDVAHTVIGVLPAAFEFVDPVQFWRPLAIPPGAPGQLRLQMVRVFGRLLPGTQLATAKRELDELSDRHWGNFTAGLFSGGPGGNVEREVRGTPPPAAAPPPAAGAQSQTASGPAIAASGPTFTPAAPRGGPGAFRLPFMDAKAQLIPLQEQLARQSRTTLWLLLGAVTFVLLIACANIANLQLARAAGRKREAGIRAALGASPWRLAFELLAENLLLALLGGALGIVFAWWGTQALEAWLSSMLPRVNPIGVSVPVLGFAVLLAAAAGLAFGLAPAWQGSRVDLLDALKEGGHQASARGHRWRQGLVALEIALALVLAVNAGLLVKSIYQLYSTELGYRTSDVLTANLSLPNRYRQPAQQRDFTARWLEALRAIPGVRSAAVTDAPPLSGFQQMVMSATVDSRGGRQDASAGNAPPAMAVASATPNFFVAAGIELKQGRFFSAQDGADAPAVAIVNEAFLKVFHPNGFTLGTPVSLPIGPGARGGGHGGPPATASIVGVVADIRPRGFESAAQPMAYFPFEQQPRQRLAAVLHFEGDASALSRAVTQATHKVDSDLALDAPSTLEDQINRQNASRRVTLALTATFAATAVVLAALGIFGVMSYTVTQRTQEIGVRMALGAEARVILRWIMRQGAIAVGAGLVAGTGLTFGTGKLLQSYLVGVTALDPTVVLLGVVLLSFIGLAACLAPALRASRVNPVVALRNE
jgi:predicted permease